MLNNLASPGTALRFEVDTLLGAPDVKTQVLCSSTQVLIACAIARACWSARPCEPLCMASQPLCCCGVSDEHISWQRCAHYRALHPLLQAIFAVTLYNDTEDGPLQALLAPLGVRDGKLHEKQQDIRLCIDFPVSPAYTQQTPARSLHLPKKVQALTGLHCP